jgi:uncharacterized protein YbaA (DUF1428 family)
MSKYVDGFVLVIPKANVQKYAAMAAEGRAMWVKLGALEYFECKGDDLTPQGMGDMKQRSFTELAKADANETVWFSFIVFQSREHRDEVNKKVMDEMSEKYKDAKGSSMPFDMQRMAYGGFSVEVEG